MRLRLHALTLVCALVVVGACGGDDEEASDVPPPPPPPDALHSPGLGGQMPLLLPAAGRYVYDVAGSSNLGPLPPTANLTVEDLPAGRQRWTIDRPERDGQASVETLVLLTNYDGIRLASHRLEQSTRNGPLVVEFEPQQPVLFVPAYKRPGEWDFDLKSKDGCFQSSTTVFVRAIAAPVPVGTATYTTYHVELDSTIEPAGRSGCQRFNLQQVQQLWLDSASHLPVQHQTRRQGSGQGLAITSDVTTSIRSTTPS